MYKYIYIEIERKINAPHRKIDYIHPMKSLYDAARIMSENTLHRLPLVERDTDNNEMIISVLSQYKILKFIGANVRFILYCYDYLYIKGNTILDFILIHLPLYILF